MAIVTFEDRLQRIKQHLEFESTEKQLEQVELMLFGDPDKDKRFLIVNEEIADIIEQNWAGDDDFSAEFITDLRMSEGGDTIDFTDGEEYKCLR